MLSGSRRFLAALFVIAFLVPAYADADCAHEKGFVPFDSEFHICTDCGEKTVHLLEKRTVPATCLTFGYSEDVCSVCGYISLQHDIVFPSSDYHDWGEWAVVREGSCLEEGIRYRTCALCGETETESTGYGDHEYVMITTPADCIHDETIAAVCRVCGETESVTTGEMHSAAYHVWSDWSIDREADCTSEGEKSRTCSVCGAVHRMAIEMKEHVYQECVFPPSEDADGYSLLVCQVCGAEAGEKYDIVHVPSDEPDIIQPDCVRDGVERYLCVNCAETVSEKVLPATGEHKWGAYETVIEATCTEKGSSRRRCAVCGAYEYREIPRTLHETVERVIPAGTVTMGYTVDVCVNCGREIGRKRDITLPTMADEEMTEIISDPDISTEGILSVTVYEAVENGNIVRVLDMTARDRAVVTMDGTEAEVIRITSRGMTLYLKADEACTLHVLFSCEGDTLTAVCSFVGIRGENGTYTAAASEKGGFVSGQKAALASGCTEGRLILIEEYLD